jgi:hypothetical protein
VTEDADAADPQVPTVPLPGETLVMDMEELGSMMDPPATDAVVVKTRVWGASSPRPLLVLDVMLRPPGEDIDLP